MGRRYSAFLMRYWQLADDTERLLVEHVQSDNRIVVTSLADAFAWVRDQTTDAAGTAASPPEQPARQAASPDAADSTASDTR